LIEKWKGLIYNNKDYSDWIEVSSLGRVRNPKTGTIRKQNLNKCGYYFVSFSMGSCNKKKTFRVHKGLAEVFIPNPGNKPQVNHIDGNKLNNNLNNLEWVTCQENVRHAYDTGLTSIQYGLEHHSSVLNWKDVNYIIQNYKPYDKKYGARSMGRKFNVSHSTILRYLDTYGNKEILND
jgi:hypothetical protein